MAINFSTQLYSPTYDVWSRPVIFTPAASQPNEASYTARGIYGTQPIDVMAEDASIVSDARTILDIREIEFSVLPAQGDRVEIPEHIGMPALGTFEILDSDANGGGETTLVLRKWMTASP